MANDSEEIVSKVRRYLQEKEGLDNESSYFIVKQLQEQIWDDIQGLPAEDEDQDDEFDDFGDDEPLPDEDEGEPEILDDDEIPDEAPPLQMKKPDKIRKDTVVIKKPIIKL